MSTNLEIYTPEEFCNSFLPKATKESKRTGFDWVWSRLTSSAQRAYIEYAKKYSQGGDFAAQLLWGYITESTQGLTSKPVLPFLKPGAVVEAFFPFADPPDLGVKIMDQTSCCIRHDLL